MSNVVLILGTVNVRKVMRKRPELFANATVERNVRQPFLGSRANFDAEYDAATEGNTTTKTHAAKRDAAWRQRATAMFGIAADVANIHADKIATDATGTLTIITTADVWEHAPNLGVYCPLPGTVFDKDGDVTGGPYFDLFEDADEVITV